MNLDNAVTVTLRETYALALNAERAESLGEVQDFGDRALKTWR